jgi:hypothetical protein
MKIRRRLPVRQLRSKLRNGRCPREEKVPSGDSADSGLQKRKKPKSLDLGFSYQDLQ